jgi:ElaB/YqjD/DUF883 family membrane-anchored ribosome-binding protein
MLGAQTALSAVIRLVSTVVILGAVYFFIVKPVLDTTEGITSSINDSVHEGLQSANEAMQQNGIHSNHLQQKVRARVRTAIKDGGTTIKTTGVPADVQKLLKCVQKAGTDVDKLQACQP